MTPGASRDLSVYELRAGETEADREKRLQQMTYDRLHADWEAHERPDLEAAQEWFIECVRKRAGMRADRTGIWVFAIGMATLTLFTPWAALLLLTLPWASSRLADRAVQTAEARTRAAVAAAQPSQGQLQFATTIVADFQHELARHLLGEADETAELLSKLPHEFSCGGTGRHITGCPHSRVSW